MPHTQSPPPLRLERVSGARWFFTDAVIAFRVLNEARCRFVAALLGIPRDGSNLVTLILIGSLARALHRIVAAPRAQARKFQSSPTAAGDTMLGAGVLKETLDSVTGHPSRDTSSAAALITVAVLAHSFRLAVAASLHGVQDLVRGAGAKARRIRAAISQYGATERGSPPPPTLSNPAKPGH